jgi:hypothetical protein
MLECAVFDHDKSRFSELARRTAAVARKIQG